jgi:hypothetical protein
MEQTSVQLLLIKSPRNESNLELGAHDIFLVELELISLQVFSIVLTPVFEVKDLFSGEQFIVLQVRIEVDSFAVKIESQYIASSHGLNQETPERQNFLFFCLLSVHDPQVSFV